MMKRFTWSAPDPAPVVIFDRVGSEKLFEGALSDLGVPVSVLPARKERIFAHPAIVLRTLARFLRRGHYTRSHLYMTYLWVCLERMGARVVITWIDNSPMFSEIRAAWEGGPNRPTFIAVQNGMRSLFNYAPADRLEGSLLPATGRFGGILRFDHYFCYSTYEPELLATLPMHRIGRYHVVGSYLLGFYREHVAVQTPVKRWTVGLPSQWEPGFGEPPAGELPASQLRRAALSLVIDLAAYLRATPHTIVVALRSDDPAEAAFYRGVFGDRATLRGQDPDGFSSYRALEGCEAVVNCFSTIGYEFTGLGKKTLLCQRSGFAFKERLAPREFVVVGEGTRELGEKLEALLALSPAEYAQRMAPFLPVAMAYDPIRPPEAAIREQVFASLADPDRSRPFAPARA
jgi:hypothetical protein